MTSRYFYGLNAPTESLKYLKNSTCIYPRTPLKSLIFLSKFFTLWYLNVLLSK